MAERHDAIVELAHDHGPCSVRHIYYAAVVAGVPNVTKDDRGYSKVQRAVLDLRRDGRIPYHLVTDSTRWMRKPTTWTSLEDALRHTARTYRRDLWVDSPWRVEVWCESESIASTVYDITDEWDIPLMVCRGQSSETFAHNAAIAWAEGSRDPVVLYIGDHDPAGLEIEDALECKLGRYYAAARLAKDEPRLAAAAPLLGNLIELYADVSVEWRRIGVTWEQVDELDLPGTRPKKDYGYSLAVEAEALPARLLHELLEHAIREYVDEHLLQTLLAAEESERELGLRIVEREFAA